MSRFDYPGVAVFPGKPGPSIDRVAYRSPSQISAFVDLRGFEDDRTPLKNPHKGWFWHYIDNGLFRPAYRDRQEKGDYMQDMPGLNHLYLRYDWGDIDRVEGHPDWSEIDRIMEEWGRYGYKFSMRICAYEASAKNPFATPEYVYKAGAKGYELENGCLEPDYGDPVFLEKLEKFLENAGKKFDGDPRLELIDIGTYGTWGEGHTGFGTNIVYPAEVIKKHIDLHTKYFPNTVLLLNDDHVNSAWLSRAGEENIDLIRYARTMGLGLQDDSVCVKPYAIDNGYTTLRTPWLFDHFWENAPIVLEFEHYHAVSPEIFRQGLPFVEAMRRTHCTYAGFHGYPRPWLEREPWLTEYCVNRLGYWYFLNGYELPVVKAGAANRLRLWVENRGYAPCYRDYDLRVALRGDGGRWETTVDARNTGWMPGESHCVTATLRPEGLRPGGYGLYVGLFEGDAPVKFAFDPSRQEDGLCHIGDVGVV